MTNVIRLDFTERLHNPSWSDWVIRTIKDNVVPLFKEVEYFEFGGIRMEKENYGRPPEDAGIEIVTDTRPFSWEVPECAENPNIPGEWLYNYPWIVQLSKVLGKSLPSKDQMLSFLSSIPGNADKKVIVMNDGKFPGFRSNLYGQVLGRWDMVHWWVSSSRCASLYRGSQDIGSTLSPPNKGASARFLWSDPDEKVA